MGPPRKKRVAETSSSGETSESADDPCDSETEVIDVTINDSKQQLKSQNTPDINFDVKTDLTDATFLIDGKRIHAGKHFLSYHSPYFHILFFKDYKEKDLEEIPLEGVSYEDFLTMLKMLHNNGREYYIQSEKAESLLLIADQYRLKAITDKVESYLMHNGCTQFSVAEKFVLADRYRLIRLHTKCFEMFDNKTNTPTAVMNSEEFSMLSPATKSACQKFLDEIPHVSEMDRWENARMKDGNTTMIERGSLMECVDKANVIAYGFFPAAFYRTDEDAFIKRNYWRFEDQLGETSFEIGGLLWTLDSKLEPREDEHSSISFCLVVNKDRPSGIDWTAEGIVEIELRIKKPINYDSATSDEEFTCGVFDRAPRRIRPIKKQYEFNLDNANRKGWTGEALLINNKMLDSLNSECRDFQDGCPGLMVITRVYIRKLTGLREIPQFDFTTPSPMSDISLAVESKILHVNKQYLSIISNLFRTRIDINSTKKIVLKGIKYEECIGFLNWIYPSFMKNLEVEKMDRFLRIAKQFEVYSIKEDIESFLGDTYPAFYLPEKIIFKFAHNMDTMNYGSFLEISSLLKADVSEATWLLPHIKCTDLYWNMDVEKKVKLLEWIVQCHREGF